MGTKSVFANMYILTNKINVNDLSDAIHNILDKSSVSGSATVLPRHDGIFARMIADTADEIKSAVNIILNKIRNDVLNKPFTDVRKY
jgi:urease accessory protein UreH